MNSCTICNKAFTRKSNLRRHMVDVHKDVAYNDVSIVHKDSELMAESESEREKQIG